MAYKKTTWATGDVITADKMNNIEEGIESVTGADSPNTKDIRDYIDTSMYQKGQKHVTLRPDDFSELYAEGKVLMPGSDASIAVETTNSAWKIYKYELGRAFVLRADQVVKNSDAAGCVPIAFRYKGVNYAVDYDRSGQYYLADTVLVSYNATNEAYAIEEFSFTETVRQEFSDSIICRDHAGEFDSLVVFGDSIFANTISNPDTGALTNNGNGVTKQLANLMGVPLYKHAVNNATLSTKYTAEAQNVVKQIQDYIASPDGGSRPLFIIEGGTNDAYHYGVSNLGTYGSSDTTTIYGAIYYAINLLLSIEGVQPWQILVCTPIPKGIRALWDGTTSFSSAGWLANTDLELTTIGHAMYEIALNRQCSVINGYNAIFDELSSQYICQLMMGDDTHPTVYGSERYARYIYDTLFSGASTKEVEEDIVSLKSSFDVLSNDGLAGAYTPALGNGTISNPGNLKCVNTTDYIPVGYEYKVVCNISRPNASGYHYVFGYTVYDENKTRIKTTDLPNGTQSVTISNANVKFIRFAIGEKDEGGNDNALRVTDFANYPVIVSVLRKDYELEQETQEVSTKIFNSKYNLVTDLLLKENEHAYALNGTKVENEQYTTTGLLACYKGMSLEYANLLNSSSYAIIITFDKYGEVIRTVPGEGWSTPKSGTFAFNEYERWFAVSVVSYQYSTRNYSLTFVNASYELAYKDYVDRVEAKLDSNVTRIDANVDQKVPYEYQSSTIFKADKNLKSGSLQVGYHITSKKASAIGYTKEIPIAAGTVIAIEMPYVANVHHYTYRYGFYKEDGTYTQVASTAEKQYTVPAGYAYMEFGVYAYKDASAEIEFNLYDAIDYVQVSIVSVATKKYDYIAVAEMNELMKGVEATYQADIVDANPDVKQLLIQAKRPINTSYNAYLSVPQPVVLLHISDIHADETELKRIVQFKGEYADMIDDTICTGDLVADRWSNGYSFWENVSGAGDILVTIGNHDVLTAASGYDWTQRATQADQYTRYFAPYIEDWDCEYTSGLTYYYKDYAAKKLRLIALNPMLTGDDNTAQLAWYETTLNDVLANHTDYSVVVADHFMPVNSQKIACNFTTLDNPVPSGELNTLSADYLAKTQAFIAANGKFVCYLVGHSHIDYVAKSIDYPSQLSIAIDCLNRALCNNYSDVQRTDGLRSQDLANLVSIDTASHVIKIIRVGANRDHYLRGKNCITIDYTDGTIVTQN